jgi:hypothetical protein
MKSRILRAVTMSLVLALASYPVVGEAASRASRRPTAEAISLHSVVALFSELWSAVLPSWDKSRGTMDPDGTEPEVSNPTVPADPLPRNLVHSRGTMDPDGWPTM